MDDRQRALVFGASGYIGTHLVPALQEAGWRVRAAARNVRSLDARRWKGVETVGADALHPQSLHAALDGVDVAFYLVHSMAAGRRFAHIEADAARNFAAASASAGIRRTVYLGGLKPAAPASQHLDSRAATGDALRAGATPVTELRAGMIVGPGSAAFEVIRDIVNHAPIVFSLRAARSLSTPIGLSNLLAYLVAVANHPDAAGQVYDVGGPEDLSYDDLMRQYAAVVGRPCRLVRLPFVTPRIAALGLGLVSSVPTQIAGALIEGLEHDVIARDEPIRRIVRPELLDFRASVRAALADEQSNATVPHWIEGSIA